MGNSSRLYNDMGLQTKVQFSHVFFWDIILFDRANNLTEILKF